MGTITITTQPCFQRQVRGRHGLYEAEAVGDSSTTAGMGSSAGGWGGENMGKDGMKGG